MATTVSFFCFTCVANQYWVSDLLVRENVVLSERSAFRGCGGGTFCGDRDGARDGAQGARPRDSSCGASAIRTRAAGRPAPAHRRIYDRPTCGAAVCEQCGVAGACAKGAGGEVE